MNLELFGDKKHLLPTIVCLKVPEAIDPHRIRTALVQDFNIEIAPGFGAIKDEVWRIGQLGYGSRKQNVLSLLTALESVLTDQGMVLEEGRAKAAALAVYQT